jgi:hypothetical protein
LFDPDPFPLRRFRDEAKITNKMSKRQSKIVDPKTSHYKIKEKYTFEWIRRTFFAGWCGWIIDGAIAGAVHRRRFTYHSLNSIFRFHLHREGD